MTQTYNNLGALENVRSTTNNQFYATNLDYDASGRLTALGLGNNVTTTYTYYAWTAQGGRLQKIQTGASLFNLQYTYDAVGNVKTITDGANSNQVQTFGYDALDRLTSAATNAVGSGQYNESYAYDAVGNFTNKAGTTYTYQDAAHKHAATHLNGAQKYTYNANGDMTQRLENGLTYTQTFNSEHQLVTVTASAGITLTTFAYDGDGQRVKQTEQKGTTLTTTLYVGPMEVVITTTGRITTSYYSAGGQLIALRVMTNTSGNTLSYLVTDHLGSASATLNSAGALVSRQLYLPYGGVRQSGNLPTDVGFTGQRLDGTGLMYYKARYYSSVSGRFISADSIVPDGEKASVIPLTVDFHEPQFLAALNEENAFTAQHGFWFQLSEREKREAKTPWGPQNPQALNRYSYVLNNPLLYIDPTGHLAGDAYNGYDAACDHDGQIDICSNGGTPIVRKDAAGRDERLIAIWIRDNDFQTKAYFIWEGDANFPFFKEYVDDYMSAKGVAEAHFAAALATVGAIIADKAMPKRPTGIIYTFAIKGAFSVESVIASSLYFNALANRDGPHQKAIRKFHEIAQKDPDLPPGWIWLGNK